MKFFALFQVTLLYFEMVKAIPMSNTTIEIQNKFGNMLAASKTTSNTGVEPIIDTVGETICTMNKEATEVLTHFIVDVMANYTTWLGNDDNLKPGPGEIALSSTGAIYTQANLHISNQYMSENSSSQGNVVGVTITNSHISLMRSNTIGYDPNVTFGGDYNVTGSFKANSILEIPFSGKGKWTLKGTYGMEHITYYFSLGSNGDVDLSNDPELFVYMPSWDEVDFQGLRFDYVGDVDESWMPKIEKDLAHLYTQYLVCYPKCVFQEHSPPRRLLNKYLQEVLPSITLEGIVDCVVDDGDGCGSILASGWLILVTIAASYYNA